MEWLWAQAIFVNIAWNMLIFYVKPYWSELFRGCTSIPCKYSLCLCTSMPKTWKNRYSQRSENAFFSIFDQVVSGQEVSYPSHKPTTLKIWLLRGFLSIIAQWNPIITSRWPFKNVKKMQKSLLKSAKTRFSYIWTCRSAVIPTISRGLIHLCKH